MKILSIFAFVVLLMPQLAHGDINANYSDNIAGAMEVVTAADESEPIDFGDLPFPDTL